MANKTREKGSQSVAVQRKKNAPKKGNTGRRAKRATKTAKTKVSAAATRSPKKKGAAADRRTAQATSKKSAPLRPSAPPFRIESARSAPPPPPPPIPEAPISTPTLLSPIGGEVLDTLTPNFRWMYVGRATRYELEWTSGSHFGKGHTNVLVSERTMVTLDEEHALKPGLKYIWRVRGGNDVGWGPWSAVETFFSPNDSE